MIPSYCIVCEQTEPTLAPVKSPEVQQSHVGRKFSDFAFGSSKFWWQCQSKTSTAFQIPVAVEHICSGSKLALCSDFKWNAIIPQQRKREDTVDLGPYMLCTDDFSLMNLPFVVNPYLLYLSSNPTELFCITTCHVHMLYGVLRDAASELRFFWCLQIWHQRLAKWRQMNPLLRFATALGFQKFNPCVHSKFSKPAWA